MVFPPQKTPKEQLDRNYVEAVERAGGIPVLLPTMADHREIPQLLSRLDGLIFSGGDDMDPNLWGEKSLHSASRLMPKPKQQFDIALVHLARKKNMPTLGICYGLQLFAVAFGGKLYQHIPDQVPGALQHEKSTHAVSIESNSKLHKITGKLGIEVHSSHHQGIKDPGTDFHVTAKSSDGLIEAIESPREEFFLAVQWHPERDPQTPELFEALMHAARLHAGAGV